MNYLNNASRYPGLILSFLLSVFGRIIFCQLFNSKTRFWILTIRSSMIPKPEWPWFVIITLYYWTVDLVKRACQCFTTSTRSSITVLPLIHPPTFAEVLDLTWEIDFLASKQTICYSDLLAIPVSSTSSPTPLTAHVWDMSAHETVINRDASW